MLIEAQKYQRLDQHLGQLMIVRKTKTKVDDYINTVSNDRTIPSSQKIISSSTPLENVVSTASRQQLYTTVKVT
jgi:hypothetical protein